MASGKEDQILEGFLCPICMTDLRSAMQLTTHFESKHQEDPAVLKSIKGLFDIFLNKKNEEAELKETLDDIFMVNKNTYDYDEQVMGVFRSSTDYFKGVRSARLERYAAETNKLLIRLDKLVTNVPTDLVNRKQHEKDVVPWLDGSTVNRCPNCAKGFNLTRRKHHCRLCGSIICHECSLFLDINEAKAIVDPSAPQPLQSDQEVTEKNGLRLCEHCYNLIELRKQVQESRNAKTILVVAYEQMRSNMDEAKPAVEMYEKMCQSLFNGEMIYNLSDVNKMRGRIGKLAEKIDLLSKQIAALPAEPGTRQAKLQNSIRQAATHYIKEELLSMRKLPTEDQIEQIKKQRYKHAKDTIESDRRKEMETIEPPEATGSKPIVVHDEDNPLLQQINIVRGLLADARKDMKFDEVAMLEANLKELKKEYQLQMLSKS